MVEGDGRVTEAKGGREGLEELLLRRGGRPGDVEIVEHRWLACARERPCKVGLCKFLLRSS